MVYIVCYLLLFFRNRPDGYGLTFILSTIFKNPCPKLPHPKNVGLLFISDEQVSTDFTFMICFRDVPIQFPAGTSSVLGI